MNLKPEWPLSLEELQQLAKPLAALQSFENLAHKYCKKVEPLTSPTFTHRCTCPSPYHKGGAERTPSFYFSEKDKFFRCFGCSIGGDWFDFITLMEGIPWHLVVLDVLGHGNINLDALLEEAQNYKSIDISNYLFELNMDISKQLRHYLDSIKSQSYFNTECKWVDAICKRIDETFLKLEVGDANQAKGFYTQISMEIDRRKMRLGDK